MEGPEHRRVRRCRPEEILLSPEMLDVGTALPTTGEHQHRLDEHLAPVVQRHPLPPRRDPRRERISEAQPVRKGPKSVQPHMANYLVTAGCHNETTRAVTVHFVSALLVMGLCVSTASVSPDRRARTRMHAVQFMRFRE